MLDGREMEEVTASWREKMCIYQMRQEKAATHSVSKLPGYYVCDVASDKY